MVPIYKQKWFIAYVIAMTLCSIVVLTADAQNVTRNGNTFTLVGHENGQDTKTEYLFKHGVETDTVYLSSTGKAFVWKTSKKSGKRYKKYVPEIGKQINPKAYEQSHSKSRKG